MRIRTYGDGSSEVWDFEGERRPRAPRFLVSLPMRYRVAGEPTWWDGVTGNVSRSGVLFSAASAITPDRVIELALCLTPGAAEVFCVGRVVRTGTNAGDAWVAALIETYRFEAPAAGRR
ncbi:MAG TPA: PilZ domain-containing protein [Vicinamibacteria bacterium]|nr:PilZ domain-containing protein [Vicinamibacteria bacterium]